MHNSVSRRRFMGAATAAAITATAAMKSTAQPNQKIRIGMVGTGNRGRELLRELVSIDNVDIAAICDDYAPHLDEGRRIAGSKTKSYGEFEAMLVATDLDALIIATPLHLHYPMCKSAIERGIAVYCESAMGHSIDEARQLTTFVEQHNAVFQLGLQRRANAVYEQAEAMVRTGMLGTITAIKCQWHLNSDGNHPLPVSREHANHDRLDRQLNWQHYWASSQGLMAEYGSHQLDVVNRLLGVAPTRVIGMGGVDYWRDGRETYDNVFCTYEYNVPDAGEGQSQTVRATYSAIQSNAHEGVSELIMGTKGTLLLSPKMGLFYTEQSDSARDIPVDGRSGATKHEPGSPWAHRGKSMQITSTADDTRASLVSFVDAARSGDRNTVCNARTGLENTATVLIANDAIRTGNAVEFPDDCRIKPRTI